MDSNGQDPFTTEPVPQLNLAPLLKLQNLQLTGLEELHTTLKNDVAPVLIRLERRPIVDVETITKKLDDAIDAMDRLTQLRIPRLVSRRWYGNWFWCGFGFMAGVLLTYWALATPRGKQLLGVMWPSSIPQQAMPAGKRR